MVLHVQHLVKQFGLPDTTEQLSLFRLWLCDNCILQVSQRELKTRFQILFEPPSSIKDGAHYCHCAHFLRMPRQSQATRKKCATRGTRELVLFPVSLGGSSYFLCKRCVVFQQMKKNFYLPGQFFENSRSMGMLLFLPYDLSD